MLVREIKQALIGKTISYYDGWGGSSNYFRIGYIKNEKTSIRVFPEKGKGWGVFIPKGIIPTLLQNGKYKENNEVECCPYEVRWGLS